MKNIRFDIFYAFDLYAFVILNYSPLIYLLSL